MAAAKLDVAILEVGLGGRLDAVNIIDADCAVITSIDLDHMELLGPDRESIGREKAGILRAGRPAIVSDPVPPQSVLDQAAEPSAPTSGCWGATSTSRATSSSGPGPGAAGATPAWPIRRCAAPTSCSTPSGVLAALKRCASGCRSPRRRCATGWRWSNCRAASRSCPASRRWCWTWRTTRIRWRRWRPISTRWGSIPRTHAVFGAMADKDLAPMFAQDRRR